MKIAFVFNRKTDTSLEQAEFDTPETIQAIHQALESGGNQVFDIEMHVEDSSSLWIQRLAEVKADLIFNTAEGFYGIGRESLGPTIFEQLQMPYVGSGPYGCFLTLDKFLTKQMVLQRKVPVIEGYFINNVEELESILTDVVYPAFVKPNYEGSSKGITERSICKDADELKSYGSQCLKLFPHGILVERFVPGKDIAVPYLSGLGEMGVLEPLEYVYSSKDSSDSGIYDYNLKNFKDTDVMVRVPALIDSGIRQNLIEMMKRIVPALGVMDFARADFRVTPDGEIYFLEMNALPSLEKGAGIFESTKFLGLTYEGTLLKIVEAALSRLKLNGKAFKAPKRILTTKTPRIGLVYNLKRKEWGQENYEREAEFDSQSTVNALKNTIDKFGCKVALIEATRTLAEELKAFRIDVVFNIAEGTNKRAREAQVPAVCDLLGIEHTGSDATCLAITLDKAITKKVLYQDQILTPNYRLYHFPPKTIDVEFKYPVIVKPNHEGTSKGIGQKSVVHSKAELERAILELWSDYKEPILCEEYIVGREFTVGILGNATLKILGPMEIVFSKDAGGYPVYSFEAKQSLSNGICHYECPVSLGRELDRKMMLFAKKVFKTLGCRDVARIDCRLDASGNIFFLEINPLPGLAPGFSDLVVLAEKCGMSYDGLIKRILTPAIQRWRNLSRVKSW